MPAEAVCPGCDAHDWDETIDEIAAVCRSCGYVVEALPINQSSTDSATIGGPASEESESEARWADTYTVANSTEQQVGHALERLEVIADELRWASPVRATAAETLGAAAKQRVTDGRSVDLIVGAALHLAGKTEQEPRPLERVARSIGTDRDTLIQTTRVLQRELALDQPVCSASMYLPFLIAEREYSAEVERRATALVETVEQTGRATGISPSGLAAAALYEASDGNVTQRDLAYDAGITTETIRVRLQDIRHGRGSE